MRTKCLSWPVRAVASALLGGAAALAHHAFAAEFDANRPVNLRGKVTRVEWINPHAWIHIDNKNDDGTIKAGWWKAARRTRCCAGASPRTR